MQRLARWITTAALVVAGAEAGAAPLAGFQLQAESDRFVFYALPGAPRAEPRKVERFLGRVERLLGHQVEGKAAYYLVDHQQAIARAAGRYTSGVTVPSSGDIMSIHPVHAHEIVHRVTMDMGDPGLFFHEGIAVAIGDQGKLGGRDVHDRAREALSVVTPEQIVERFVASDAGYAVAGSFVAYLIDTYGLASVGDFFRGCRGRERAPRQVFAGTFGISLEEAFADWRRSL